MRPSVKSPVVVMLGGPSAEREVSLRSGAAVARALRGLGHEVVELDPADGGWVLPRCTEAVFLALHGTYGEDGEVQRRLDEMGVCYTGSGAEASRVAFDKALTKERCGCAGVPTPAGVVLGRADAPWPTGLGPSLVVKPVCQGSSVGLGFVDGPDAWAGALAEAFRHDTRVLVESRVTGRELTVGILEGKALPIVEVRPGQGGYDYRNKYTAGATGYTCPADLDGASAARVRAAALGAFGAVGARDYGRVDVMLDEHGGAWVLEVNTLPGMTETSLLPKAAAAGGLSFEALCERMLAQALRRRVVGTEVPNVA